MGLTKRQVDAVKYEGDGKSQHIVYDGDLPGFGVRIYPSGQKSFVLRYRNASGRIRFLTLGKDGVMTVADARDAARRALLGAATGSDPVEERKAGRRGVTVKEFADLFIDRYAKPRKKSWKLDRAMLDNHVLPRLGSLKLKDVRRSDIAELHSAVGAEMPTQANRLLALLSRMFNLASVWGHLPETAPNPTRQIARYEERSRERFVGPTELPTLLEKIEAEPNLYIRAVLLLYLLTGARRSELLSLQWSHVDLKAKEIRLPDTKAGRVHTIPLSAPAVAILADLPRQKGNPYVFPGRKKGKPLNNINKAWNRIRRAAKMEDVWIHDLRRTMGSWMASDGASLQVIGSLLNHSNLSTTQVYARLMEGTRRQAIERHGDQIMKAQKSSKGPRQ